jgi:hypothetical protein
VAQIAADTPRAPERRQLTELSSRLDPEDLSGVIRAYQERVATVIARFGGFIARYVGDGVLIYVGWPEAHEANAERAVRAPLAIIEAISQAPVRAELLQVASASPPVWWLLSSRSAGVMRDSRPPSARPPIWPPVCRLSPSPTGS